MFNKAMAKTFTLSACLSSLLLADISGVVYKDFDLNGKKDGGDAGVSGVTVTAVCNDGNSSNTTTNKDGEYILSGFSSGAICRVEANPDNAGVGSGPNENGSAPLVDMVADGAKHDISTGSPATYCQPNPDVVLAATAGWFTDDDDNRKSPEGFGTIFKVPTPAVGDFNGDDTIDDKRDVLTKSEDTGAIWGAAWQKSAKKLFVSAAIKRYVPLKDETTKPKDAAGAIYRLNADGTGLELFTIIEDVITDADADIISSRNYDENEDTDIKELVGIKGLGDLDISEDDKYLYTINLKNKTLIKIDAASGDILSATAIPNPYGASCTDEMVRPWALKIRANDIFIGSVCEDEILDGDDPKDMDARGLGAAIQKYNGTDFSNVAQTNTLRFLRPKGYNPKRETSYQYQNTDWSHGRYEWLPQPMLTDIEFNNNGDLVLGYTDRSIMIRERGGSHGDIRKMCLNTDGTFTDESTAAVETDCASTKLEYKDNDEDYYEFYVGDYFNGRLGEDGHPETASGALAQAPGQDNIIVGMVDGTDWYQPGSIGLYSHKDGDKKAAQAVIKNHITTEDGEREPFGAKAGGMGDVELLCDPAPIEVGNYVWMDLNEDGIQDAGEPAFKDINVTLKCNDTVFGVATTDKNGHYYFGGIDNANLNDGKVVTPGLECELSLKKADVNDKDASEQNPNSNDNDSIDNDAAADGDVNKFTFNTTASNDHTLDFGILPAKGCVTGTLNQTSGPADAANSVTVTLKDSFGNTFTTETDGSGNYAFDDILAGEAIIEVDTADTDINEATVWETNTTTNTTVEERDDASCTTEDFDYKILSELAEVDPADSATCANPTSIVWEGSDADNQNPIEWDSLKSALEGIETTGGEEVTITSMRLTLNDDDELNDDKSGTESGGGYNGAPFLSFYLGDQATAGDGSDETTYDLKANEKMELTVEFEEPVVLDNWRVRDVDSGDKRDDVENWDWQDAVKMVGYDAEGNVVDITAKMASDTTSIVDAEGFVRTDIGSTNNCALVPTNYNDSTNPNYQSAGANSNCEGADQNGTGYTAEDPEGQVVFTSNFIPLTKIVITHKAGPDLPHQTRSALAMFGFAVCKPLHVKGTVFDDKDGTDQADCDTNSDIDGEVISEIDAHALNACLLDEDGVVVDTQTLAAGQYDFSTNIHPNTSYGMLITTSECTVGNQAPSGDLAEDWNYEGEMSNTSPDGDLDGYVDIQVEDEDVTEIDFAINKTPTALGYQREVDTNPKDDVQVDFVNDGKVTSDFITDVEQGTDVTINIVKINNGQLYYDDTLVHEDDNLIDPDFSNFTVDPDDGDVKSTFTYKVIDQACRVSDVALFEAPFTTVAISGNLFLDMLRNDTVDGEGTPFSCDGSTKLYANLVGTDGNVLASTELNAEGGYVFSSEDGIEENTEYTIVLSLTKATVGEAAPEATLTQNCLRLDGENIGTDAGTDGNADGKITVSVEEVNINDINFAITPTVKVGDRVWIENDNDGNASTGEITPVVDTTVTLTCGDEEQNTQTDDNGNYLFTLPVNIGECTVKVATPEDTIPTQGSNDNNVDDSTTENDLTHDGAGTTLTVGENDNLTVDFGFTNVGSWSGNVSEDIDNDDNGDINLEGVTIKLYADDNNNGKVDSGEEEVASTVTDENGNYIFETLKPGNYVAVEMQPEGYLNVTENEGGADADKADNGITNAIAGTVDAGEEDSKNDFVEEKPASLGDRVWFDNNRNGIQDADEDGVKDVTVALVDTEGNTVKTATTDANGNYKFDNLEPETYHVEFDKSTLPAKYVVTPQDAGDDSKDSDADTDGKTIETTLNAGENDTSWDMGINQPLGDISGNVSKDTDNDNNGDKPLADVILILLNENGTEIARTSTDTDGNYLFEDLLAGAYTVVEEQPAGYFDVKENDGGSDNDTANNHEVNRIDVIVDAGEIDIKNDFVEVQEASLGDRVWYDSNTNGQQDNDELGVENITIYLFDNKNNILTQTKTDNEGNYRFEHLNPMIEYVVNFDTTTLPEGYVITSKDGSSENDDSDAETSGKTDAIQLTAGEYYPDIDMGIHREGAKNATPYYIGTHFWIDNNKNGIFDDDEEGVAGSIVELLDQDGNKLYWTDETQTTLTKEKTGYPAEVKTDENGAYHFYVAAGTYSVRFNMPDAYNEYVFDAQQENDDQSTHVNAADNRGVTVLVTVGPNSKADDLTLDAGIYCSCDNATIKSNGASALGIFSTMMMMFLTLLSGLYFIRQDENEQGA